MLVWSLLLLTLFLSGWGGWLLGRSITGGLQRHWPAALAGLAVGAFVLLYGTWVYLSVYLKWAVVPAYLLTIIIASLRAGKRAQPQKSRRMAANLVTTAVFGSLAILYYTGTTGSYKTVDLHFPLKSGHYIILQGGKGLPANVFHYNSRRAVFAIDIARLNRWGNRADGVFSRQLEDYAIFSDTIYSPAAGTVELAVSDNPDNIPPDMTRGPHNLNRVVLEAADCTIFMGHMRQNKVFVKTGDTVSVGQPLGLVGNSGASIEPHLHIQAHAKGSGPWYTRPQLFITFDGRGYLLFEQIDATRSPDAQMNRGPAQ